MPHTYDYPRPALTADCVIFGYDEDELKLLLIQRDLDPFAGRWALPGGFVNMDESLDDAARRELAEETGVRRAHMEQLATFGTVDRDPRGRVVTVAYYALVALAAEELHAATDARQAAWFCVSDLPDLAFDHQDIIDCALARLQAKVRYQPIGFELLPPLFTLTQLQRLYETVLEQPLDKRNFRKRVLAMGVLEDSGEIEQDVAHRAARLYRFDRAAYDQAVRDGFEFRL